MRKVAVIGGGGIRTPLVIYGLAQAHQQLGISEVLLFDIDVERAEVMARLGREIARRLDARLHLNATASLEEALTGAEFVLNSIRVGGMSSRARDERIAIDHGFAGQETTGPGGAAMALRTLPAVLEYAEAVQRFTPQSWFINFTNPAGLVTQALTQHTGLRVIGICDTPAELFHRIAASLGEPLHEMRFDYAGLNHLGWVRRVELRGRDVTAELLASPTRLRQFYSAGLFDPALLQTLGLIPTEYLFFYYSQHRAYRNQLQAGATRGAELERMNTGLFEHLADAGDADALAQYRAYLMRRNASYMKLEAEAGSAFSTEEHDTDPFETATGYHRIALDVMHALLSQQTHELVVNVPNGSTIPDLEPEDVVEVPCDVDSRGARPRPVGRLPESVRGLVQAVKAYERSLIRAALSRSKAEANLALLEYPIIGQWEQSVQLLDALRQSDPEHLAYLQ